MTKWQKFWGHLRTIQKHRKMVRKLCFKCGLYWQGLTHDISKYSPTEFWNGVKFYTGTKSPHVGEREAYGYSKAWLHHKGRNKHHADYWIDILSNGETGPVVMPVKYFAEMMCDRIAASMIYLGEKYTDYSPLEYYYGHKDENKFEDSIRSELEYWLEHLATYGLDYAINDLRKTIKIEDRKEKRKL